MVLAWLAVGGLGLGGSARAGLIDLGGGISGQYALQFGHQRVVNPPASSDGLVEPHDPGVVGVVAGGDAAEEGGASIGNRLGASLAVLLHRGNYGLVLRGHAHDERAWIRLDRDDSSPWRVHYNHFAPRAVLLDSDDAELQEAYVYSHWQFADGVQLKLQAGRQRVDWAQSVFSAGLTGVQGTLSPIEAALPGVDLRGAPLAVDQVALHLRWNDALSLSGYYRLHGVQGVRDVPLGIGMDWAARPTDFLLNPVALGRVVPKVVAVGADDFGRWGAGLRYQLGSAVAFGGYFIRYITAGFGVSPAGGGVASRRGLVDHRASIDLYAASLSTHLGPVGFVGQANFRDGARRFDGIPDGVGSLQGQAVQTLVSASYTLPLGFLSDGCSLTGEAGYMHVGVAGSAATSGAWDANVSGFQSTMTLALPHLLPGWDARFPLTLGVMDAQGFDAEAMPGVIGAGAAQRVGVGARFSYLSRLEIGIGYAVFLDSAGTELSSAVVDSAAGLSFRYAL